ncbi:unnamed protein product [Urochloa decumbens]|uniref:Cytochrome P450 n=1 Tax=Urochloa decumbens TaxID=240449 RepID=A0ABC9ARU0_9POAL
MEGYYSYLLCLLLAVLFVVHANNKRRRGAGAEPLRLPPGPWQLPVIGSLHHIAGRLPHRAMRDLSRWYGPVMLLRLGEVPTVVISSREAAREVMKTHDVAFASRPLSATLSAMTDGGRDIIFAPYGDRWRRLRKVAVVELLSARRVLSFRPVRSDEVAAMLRSAAAKAKAAAADFDMRAALEKLVADTTMRAAVGDRCRHREVLLRELELAVLLSGGFNPADLWPSSRLVGRLSGVVGRATACRDAVFEVLDSIIKDHLERMDMDKGGAGEVEDFLRVLLGIHKDGSLDVPLDMDDIKVIIFDIFAGSETTSVVLEWAMAELIRNPKSMERATAEVRRAFASRGAVAEDALMAGELRYLQHVVRETFRLHAPVPLLVPRLCQEPRRVLGYDVPRGTTVLVNAWALGRDEGYWPKDPEEFRPERFEEGGGAAAVDLRGANFELVPFGSGRRMCPGMPFGLALVEHALAALLLHFDWEAPGIADPTKLDMTEEFGITARRKNDLLLRPILRVPVPGL